ncbi:MAG: Crp/Fnr family transcriptional regulator [Thermodesulfovibrionales bacterium]
MQGSSSDVTSDLRAFPCLSSLDDEEIGVIERMARRRSFSKGETLFSESDPVEFFYTVKSGAIKLFKTSEEGRELTVRIMGPNDFFCCAPLYASGRHFVSASAVVDSEIVTLPADGFKAALFKGMSDTGMRIINGLCGKIKYLSNLLEEITFKGVEQRVLVTLLRLADEEARGGPTATLSFTHQDIAAFTGTVREVVSRIMLKLKREGVIVDSSARGFTVDRARLLDHLNIKQP